MVKRKGSTAEKERQHIIETHRWFKRTLFIQTKHNMQILGVIPIIKLQNDS